MIVKNLNCQIVLFLFNIGMYNSLIEYQYLLIAIYQCFGKCSMWVEAAPQDIPQNCKLHTSPSVISIRIWNLNISVVYQSYHNLINSHLPPGWGPGGPPGCGPLMPGLFGPGGVDLVFDWLSNWFNACEIRVHLHTYIK